MAWREEIGLYSGCNHKWIRRYVGSTQGLTHLPMSLLFFCVKYAIVASGKVQLEEIKEKQNTTKNVVQKNTAEIKPPIKCSI